MSSIARAWFMITPSYHNCLSAWSIFKPRILYRYGTGLLYVDTCRVLYVSTLRR